MNPLLDARGVTAVLFKRFVTRQGSEDDALRCTLEFAEYEPLIGRIEGGKKPPTKAGEQALPNGQGGGGGGGAASATPAYAQDMANGYGAAASALGGK